MIATRFPTIAKRPATVTVWTLVLTMLFAVTVPGRGLTAGSARAEPFRPQYHFSTGQNWMNDPNGLVWYRGEYHLFYQYNPQGATWGNMSWGHAVSTDLIHWRELGVAIPKTDDEQIFSGSVVVDERNTSGFGDSGNPPLVAVYTSWYPQTGIQAQSLAYSTDSGRTWTKYSGNPVLDLHSTDFRDPKVSWYAPGGYWLMVVALPTEHKIQFYRSDNLHNWTLLSDFGPANAVGGMWEVPDLFELPVDGNPGAKKWVLVVSVNPGAVAGGSGAQYFIGEFDGIRFSAENVITGDDPPPGTVFADFEGSYGGWTVQNGPADGPGPFGTAPYPGTVPGQLPVSGYHGGNLVNSFLGSDASKGRLTSPPFVVTQDYINLLVGGGSHRHQEGTGDGSIPAGDVLFDFETAPGTTFEDAGWTGTGGLTGRQPASGALPGQQAVDGFFGHGLLNTFLDGDRTTGTLTSPEFTLTRSYLNLLVGGGQHRWGDPTPTSVNLLVDGQVVRSSTGDSSEQLNWASWQVGDLVGRRARLQVVDDNDGGWGHLLLDQVVASDGPARPRSTETAVNLVVDGTVVRTASGQDSERLDWVGWDVRDLVGRTARIQIDDANSGGWGHILVDHIMFSDQRALSSTQRYSWVDYGKDFYAVTSWENDPTGARRWIGWMNNWQYAERTPTAPWRSAMSLPRQVSLRTVDGQVRLVQRPVNELATLRRGAAYRLDEATIVDGVTALPAAGETLEIQADFQVGSARQFGLQIRSGTGEDTEIGYDTTTGQVYVDRDRSGAVGFDAAFPGRHAGPLTPRGGHVQLTVLVDRASVEVFAGCGETVITDQIFPDITSQSVSLVSRGGTTQLHSLSVQRLGSAFGP